MYKLGYDRILKAYKLLYNYYYLYYPSIIAFLNIQEIFNLANKT